ncbi:ABC transporter permease [Gracilimonas sp. BCB1]|uniref:ABC transporter permease n=1 Tax=Gracilimonas sp. BCB1 TaxID=3152362 RepID=UPI0032D94B87
MLKNYFKIAFRNFYRNKENSIINIFGLSVALLCCIVIFLFVRAELSVDNFHTNADQIYRLTFQEINRPGARHFATTSPPMGPALVESFPEIEQAVRFRFPDSNILSYKNRQFYEYNVAYADSSLFSIFEFPLAKGNPATALKEINSVVITAPMAQKYFGDENPLGKSLYLDNQIPLTVTGVFEEIPSNTHLNFDFIISFDTFEVPRGYPVTLESWGWVSFYTYVKLSEQADPDQVAAHFNDFLITHMGEDVGANRILHLQPLDEIYLASDLRNASEVMRVGNRGYIFGLSAIALFLLVIACFNYMNLSTAQAMRRSKEVGVRKTLGAKRSSLMGQFIFESILLTLLSICIALLFLEPVVQTASSLLGMELKLEASGYLYLVPVFLLLSVVVGVLAGFYPSFMLSNFRPSKALKGSAESGSSVFSVRKVLVVGQFIIAIVLIAGSLIIRNQIQFIQSKDLGFNEEQVIVLHMNGEELTRRFPTIKNELLQNRHVVNASLGGGLLDGRNGTVPVYPAGDDPEGYPMNIYGVHFDYFETMGIRMDEGRSFAPSFATDSADGIVINQSAARALGWDNPIGKELRVSDIMDGYVIGVAEDFHFASLHRQIQPLVMYIPPTNMEKVFVRLQPGNLSQSVASLQESWKSVVPDFPFSFIFLDEHLNQLYQTDQRFLRLLTVFTILTILVACMGLYGLITYMIQRRSKEIGVRKILGAKASQITWLLSSEFSLMVGIAFLISIPICYFAIQNWLQEFAYRVPIPWWVFLLAGFVSLVIAISTISYQTIKAALANPVKSLRSE